MPGPVDAPQREPLTASPAAQPGQRPVDILLTRLDPDLPVPAAARPGDAGVDLSCTADVVLVPGERALVGTGIAIGI